MLPVRGKDMKAGGLQGLTDDLRRQPVIPRRTLFVNRVRPPVQQPDPPAGPQDPMELPHPRVEGLHLVDDESPSRGVH